MPERSIRDVVRRESFNSSVLDSGSWFYLLLFKFFPALFTGLRQRVYPGVRCTIRNPSDGLTVTMPVSLQRAIQFLNIVEPLTVGLNIYRYVRPGPSPPVPAR